MTKYLLSFLFFSAIVVAKNTNAPSAYNLPNQYIKKINLQPFNAKTSGMQIPLFNKKIASFSIQNKTTYSNGDFSFESKTLDSKGYISATVGKKSIFGQMHYDNKHYILTTEESGSWLIELPNNGVTFNSCGFKGHNQHLTKTSSSLPPVSIKTPGHYTVIDLLFIYNQALADRYPGDLLQTRLNQYLNVANQGAENSKVVLKFRNVASEQIAYDLNNNNFNAIVDMNSSLKGDAVVGMENLKQLRETNGADVVVFFRPHDIETRGSCGVAYYPVLDDVGQFDPDFGLQMVNDGMDSWSICTDEVMIHELGHNLGAAHNDAPKEQRFKDNGAGFAKIGQFTTIMGSFGTGNPERFYSLRLFSNPNLQCGGENCGSYEDFNNASVIKTMKNFVAAYQEEQTSVPIPVTLEKIDADHDGDGFADSVDAFPFDPTETNDSDNDGVGDNNDVFPTNSSEQFDTDKDGIGNNADSNDDGDSVDDDSDYFPLDKDEINDTDRDGIGDNSDAFPTNRFEQVDYDNDTIGDNQDSDDDNDGFNDVDVSAQDLLVINTGSNQILRFDAQTGKSVGIELLAGDGLLTFQSDLTYRPGEQVLFYTSSSSVKRLDLSNRNPLGEAIPAYIKTDFQETHGIALFSGFPTSLINLDDSSDLLVTKLGDRFPIIYRGSFPTVYETNVSLFENYVDENGITIIDVQNIVDVIYDDSDLYFLGQTSQIFKGQVADYLIQLLGADDHSWMNKPYAFVKTDDGRLLISNQNSHEIGIVNANSGAFKGVLTDISNHGYSNPTGIAVTKENVLLVAANDQNAILKFNAGTGEFLGELVKGNGLDNPYKMILVPKLNDRFHHDAQKVIRPNAGLWYNPETSGRGFDIQVFANNLSVIWYTYDAQGFPTWYISSGELKGFDYTGSFQKTHLNPDASVSVEDAGSIDIHFNSERQAQVQWQIGANQGTENIKWLYWGAYDEEINNYTGLWGRPDGPGWGTSVTTLGETSIAVPYIYDANGEPRWLISSLLKAQSPLTFELSAVFSDTLCPSCSGVSSATVKPAGSMTLDLSADKKWNSSIQFPSPAAGDWLLNDTDIKLFSSEATRSR